MSYLQEPPQPGSQEIVSRFEEIMASTPLPESGPAHFEARRALWRTPVSVSPTRTEQPAKLIELLEQKGPLDADETWNRGVDRIWKGVTGGGRLKRRLPMRYLITVLQAGWMRDGTWQKGYVAPEPDDELVTEPESVFSPSLAMMSNYSSGLTTPATDVAQSASYPSSNRGNTPT